MERPSTLGRIGKAVVLTAIVLVVLLPFYVVVVTSLSPATEINRVGGLVLWPGELSLGAYREVLSNGVVTRAILVSIGITAVGTALSVTVTTLAAYGLSRPDGFASRPLLIIVLITFLFTPGIIPSYLMVRSLGLLDSFAALILPHAVFAFHLVIMRSFFMSLPSELIDSARIDGAGEFRILARIVVPLSKAVIAVIALYYAVGYWNAFFNAVLYLNDSGKWPMQLVVRTYVLQGNPLATQPGAESAGADSLPAPLAVQTAVVVLAILPILFLYPFVQRHFVKGVILGAVKG